MTDFEPFDDDLAVALQRRAPQIDAAGIGTASAHDAVLARARGIRRRRAGIAGCCHARGRHRRRGPAAQRQRRRHTGARHGTIHITRARDLPRAANHASAPSTSLAPETSTRESVPPVSTTQATPITTMPETALSTMPAATVDAQPPPSIGGQ